MSGESRASLDLTHILYDSSSHVSLGLALITLSPILLMSAYAALAVQTRELLIINMWAGQLACEALNWLLKRAIKQDRPKESIGNGYGFPSSHSQWMGYFASFLMMHLYFRHRFASTGLWVVDRLFRALVYLGLVAWTGSVCYSRRYHLSYHTPPQIIWGLTIGCLLGCGTYFVLELVPSRCPLSIAGNLRRRLLDSGIAKWARLRDGWAAWEDGGREEEWRRWRTQWERNEGRRWKDERVPQRQKSK
ncbi:PAP2-domain-containing protein [Gautieria morchelliformis]|nr:PAP2-domain-containing protein [Gautieria morchelliformis]